MCGGAGAAEPAGFRERLAALTSGNVSALGDQLRQLQSQGPSDLADAIVDGYSRY
jgi:hypothetical protein